MMRMAKVSIILCLAVLLSMVSAWAGGRGLHKQLYVVPVPGKVTIDAKLNDWDLSPQIKSYVIPETADMMSAKLAMMYDKDALYISGEVRDTSPMMNRHDPKTDPYKAWDADVCQIFFSLDPDLPYPIEASSFAANPVAPVGTMMLWHYTDRQEACLSMYRGMRFSDALRPELGKDGVIPLANYQGAYRKADDGRGYTFEYRIPWATFGMVRVPKAGDILAACTAVFWSTPDGLSTAGGAAWAWDVMGAPGFAFQSTTCWGKLRFTDKGKISRDLVEAGLPPEKPLPLKFTYSVPRDSEVTVQLFDKDGKVVRILVPQQARRAGDNVELWDGLDDQGTPLPAGSYTWKGIYHDPITTKYRFSAHNSDSPAYPTADNRGGWGADHGVPTTACQVPGGMALAWNVAEYGSGIIRVDANGKKLWGSRHTADHLATDGKRLFVAGGLNFHADGAGVAVLDLADSRPLNFPGKGAALLAPDGGDKVTDQVTGLVYHAGRVYAAFSKRNLIAVYDAETGALQTTWIVPAPERMAVRPDGTLAVVSEGKVVIVDKGKVTPWITTHLDTPMGIAVGTDGTTYVANQGALQNVSVFSKDGTYLRGLGKAGGRPEKGRYDRQGMYMAGGIGLDAQNHLWVA